MPNAALRTSMMRTWTPANLGGCVQNLNASYGVTLTSAKVSQWDDISGNGKHATQGTAGNRPTVNATGINSGATVVFTGTNFLNHFLRLQVPCTVAFIALTTKTGADYAAVNSVSSGGGGAFIYARSGAAQQWGYYATGNVDSGASLLNTFKRCIVIARANNDMDLRTNGSSVTVATGVSAYAAGGFVGAGNAGGTQNLEGEVAVCICFNRVLTVAESQRIEAYWKSVYNL